jgi:hypothetical protein
VTNFANERTRASGRETETSCAKEQSYPHTQSTMGASLSSLAGSVGGGGNGGNGKKPAEKHVLCPPLFERDLKARSRLSKSSYDYLFAKPALRWLLGDYFESGLNSVLFFAPPLDPRISIKAKLGNGAAFASPPSAGGGAGAKADPNSAAGGYGNMAIRFQPLGAHEPSTFVDVKANPRVAGDVAVRACFFAPDTGLGVFAALPLSPGGGATGRKPELGVRFASPTLSAGSVVQPSTGEVSGLWVAGKLGDLTAGLQLRPNPSQPSAAFARALLDELSSGGSSKPAATSTPFLPTLSSSPSSAARWLRDRASFALAYTPGGDGPEAHTRAGQPTFCAGLEVVEGRALIVSFYQHQLAVRRVFNPFEGSDVVGISNPIDVGLRLVMPLLAEEGGGGGGSSSSSAGHIQLGAAWQPNKNLYCKARLGSDGVAAAVALKSWYQPSFSAAATAEWRFGGAGLRYGVVAQVENFGALRYERPTANMSAAAHGAALTQKHEATAAEQAMARRERALVPGDEAFGARNVEPASQVYL